MKMKLGEESSHKNSGFILCLVSISKEYFKQRNCFFGKEYYFLEVY